MKRHNSPSLAARLALALTLGAAVGAAAAGPFVTVNKYDERGNLIRSTSTASDPDNCGGGGIVCSANHVARACAGGVCAGTCATGFADCNGNRQADACEVSLTAVSNCGACGIACSSNHVTPACASGSCAGGACASGWGDCNANKQTDGCETDLGGIANCGACGVVCSTNHVVPYCSGGACAGTCAAGWADCNGNKRTDGCEVSLLSDPSNCGVCGRLCAAGQICSSGTCANPVPPPPEPDPSGGCRTGYKCCEPGTTKCAVCVPRTQSCL